MRKLAYVAILASLFFAPLERLDVAKLLPVQAVAIYIQAGQVVLETDTENIGRGADVAEALENLKKLTSAVVYLDTAEYLLVSPDAADSAVALKQYLKPSVKVCVCNGAGRVKDAAKYVEIHGNLTKLCHWKP